MKIIKRTWIKCIISIYSLLLFATAKAPNFIIIQTDDMGYDDFSMRGTEHLQTPRLDKLASESVEFSQFYVHPVCAASRASLLTGRHYLKTGVWGVHGGRDFMNLDETTIAEILKPEGYATGMFGKWHTGRTEHYYPWDRGFDEAYMAHLYTHKDNTMQHNGSDYPTTGWVTQNITDLAINFIEENKDKDAGFFAYVSYLAPHEPWKAPEHLIRKYTDMGLSQKLATIYGMLDNLDSNIGRLLDQVEELGLSENTVILFMSDNGPWKKCSQLGFLTDADWELRNPSGLKNWKGKIYENGVRSPLFVKQGSKFSARIDSTQTTIMDILPTILDMAGVSLPSDNKPLDGKSFKNILSNPDAAWPQRNLFYSEILVRDSNAKTKVEYGTPLDKTKAKENVDMQVIGIRSGDYKLVTRWGGNGWDLYNIANDPTESKNLYSSQPQISATLQNVLNDWYKNDILADTGSYTTPVFRIGGLNKKEYIVGGYGPKIVGGNVLAMSHTVQDFKVPGDYSKYIIDVREAGNYKLNFTFNHFNKSGAIVKVSVDNMEKTLNMSSYQPNFGIFPLNVGMQELTIRVTKAGTDTNSDIFNNLANITFTKTNEEPDVDGVSIYEDKQMTSLNPKLLSVKNGMVSMSLPKGNFSIKLMSLNGKVVEEIKGISYGKNVEAKFSEANLSSGIYLLSISHAKGKLNPVKISVKK